MILDVLIMLRVQKPRREDGIVIACGMAIKGVFDDFNSVFHKADKEMHAHKSQLKEKRPSPSLR